MKLNKILLLLFVLSLMIGCGGGGGGGSSSGGGGSQTTATLVSIAVTPSNPGIALGTTQQFTAMGTFSDKSTQDITTSVTWSSSAASVATIINASASNPSASIGQAVSVSTGTITSTTITATKGAISGSTLLTVTGVGVSAANVLPISVDGPVCNTYQNEPCVNVTVCTPGTSNCQTIDGILLDTASYGLRIFKQALNVPFTQGTAGSGALAECVAYADGTSDWGPVQIASVSLGSEPAVQVPIQVIDYTFGTAPSACALADQGPSDEGFNGILGIGPFIQDCGAACAASAALGQYYSCNGTACIGTAVPLINQVQNPVALLPTDNNGILVQLPSVPSAGLPSVNGSLVFGIGTQSNNSPSGATTFALDNSGDFTTTFNNIAYSSFLDTGSNGLFFSSPYKASSGPYAGLLPNCTGDNPGWFCPPSTTSFSATIAGASGSKSGTVQFQVGNFNSLTSSSNNVFSDIGGNGGGVFDWGLPFYFGRNVYMGLQGKVSGLGTGPYFAY